MDHPFRSAAFGGFNRQDVLDYLEKTAAENARKELEPGRQPIPPSRSGPPGWSWRPTAGLRTC